MKTRSWQWPAVGIVWALVIGCCVMEAIPCLLRPVCVKGAKYPHVMNVRTFRSTDRAGQTQVQLVVTLPDDTPWRPGPTPDSRIQSRSYTWAYVDHSPWRRCRFITDVTDTLQERTLCGLTVTADYNKTMHRLKAVTQTPRERAIPTIYR